MSEDIVAKVRELSEVKSEIEKLNERKKALEAYFLERGGVDVTDTKYKSATYSDPCGHAAVTYTEAESLTINSPNYLKTALGAIFPDVFDEVVETKVKPKNKDIERMLIGMYTGKGLVTATQVLSEDRTTYNTVSQLQRQLRPVLEALSRITVTLARFYGIECEDGECAIEFGDSVFEDTGTEFNRRFQMVQAGLLKPEEFNAWYFGVPLDKAREMLPPMSEAFGGEQ